MIVEKILQTERAQQKYRTDAYFKAAVDTIRHAEAGRTNYDVIETIGILLCDLTDSIEAHLKARVAHARECPMRIPYAEPPGYVI